jgi:hypothetical protein
VSRIVTYLRWQALLLVVAFLVGCGGSEKEQAEQTTGVQTTTTSEGQAPSKQAYIAQGDAICADVQSDAAKLQRQAQQLQAQSDELPEAEFLRRAASFWGEQIQVMERFRGDLARLGAPSGDEERIQQFLKSIDDGITIAREMKATLEDGREVPASKVEEYGQTVVRGNTLAQAYGFEVCGSNP